VTNYPSVRSAIESMKLGAVEYLGKPFDHGELIESLRKALVGSDSQPADGGSQAATIPGMIGRCPEMQELFRRMRKLAGAEAPILINGESGTGKELVARTIHQLGGSPGPFVAVNCAAIAENRIETELFGYPQDAAEASVGLIDSADGGTLFLDEIGELPLTAQGRLVRVLQDGEIRLSGAAPRKINLRLIAATRHELRQRVAEHRFREDLYYRINVMSLRIPPLRERGADTLELARMILRDACQRLQLPRKRFGKNAERAILSHSWPGNVRELENAIERAVLLGEGESIEAGALILEDESSQGGKAPSTDGEAGKPEQKLSLEDYFRQFVFDHQDFMTETELASKLGISRKCLWERRQRFGIPRKKKQPA